MRTKVYRTNRRTMQILVNSTCTHKSKYLHPTRARGLSTHLNSSLARINCDSDRYIKKVNKLQQEILCQLLICVMHIRKRGRDGEFSLFLYFIEGYIITDSLLICVKTKYNDVRLHVPRPNVNVTRISTHIF